MSRMLEDLQPQQDKALTLFQYVKSVPLGQFIRIKHEVKDFERVKLLRRGRQSIRVQHEDGTIDLVSLGEILLDGK
jgi:hypothetical protein